MRETTISLLESEFNANRLQLDDISKQGIILFMLLEDNNKEIIVNANGQKKIDYIKQAYTNELKLKANENIRIKGFAFFDTRNIEASLSIAFLIDQVSTVEGE